MRKCIALLCVVFLLFFGGCGQRSPRSLTQAQAQEKLAEFLEIFDFSEAKEYRYESTGSTMRDGRSYFGFTVYWVEDGAESCLGEYLVCTADGSLLPAAADES